MQNQDKMEKAQREKRIGEFPPFSLHPKKYERRRQNSPSAISGSIWI